ncbi:hypothetical protein COLO4_27302 [Corchorus olitorius]|uniref:BHLH domain-containing protein n=1 Tax=Corchorus olitorius TaxID=93759 RepID=A0A1R3HRL0_9ROSI|nr:hypothetical protein COLO4_27302 [Corchorus olitorius]
MALEAVVFQQDPFSYGCSKDFYGWSYDFGFQKGEEKEESLAKSRGFGFSAITNWGSSSPSLMVQQQQPLKELWDHSNSSSPDNAFPTGEFSPADHPPPGPPPSYRRKRRRTKTVKNKEEIENQRMTHIAVERNRRRQMNDYLAVLRSMMPPSYGDQASIIGGAINFVKELEQLLQSLEAKKRMENKSSDDNSSNFSSLFSDFFTFPQYSTSSTSTHHSAATTAAAAEKHSSPFVADVEVTMVESHANLKILSKRHPKQLLKLITGLHSLGLYVLHLNVTSVENMLNTVNEIAGDVYEMVDRLQEEAAAASL